MSELLRKGRLASARKDIVQFTSSMRDDKKILRHVVDINKAHVIMMIEKEIISQDDGKWILEALAHLERMKLSPELEDIHVAIEEEVIKAAGNEVGGNLNLAKSRNDQVATAIRMKLREELLSLVEAILGLQKALIGKAEGNLGTIIPGYTHLQPAQPITLAHYMLAQLDVLERSVRRLEETYSRVNLCPMGAGALATTSLPISRERVADLLGFDGVLENSLDAIASRDFVLEVLAVLSVTAVDVTRFVEDLVIWSSMEFGMIELPDEFASTSSIMPQKKNPEVLEVVRARMSLIPGDFLASAIALKALPSAYDLDFQEVTPRLWSAIKTAKDCVRIFIQLLPRLKVRSDLLSKSALSFLTSTELANMLVKNHKIPFRTAHRIVGALVRVLVESGRSLEDTTPELLAKVSQELLEFPVKVTMKEIRDAVDPTSFIESHKARGGPSKQEVSRMLKTREASLTLTENWISEKKLKLEQANRMLDSQVRSHFNSSLLAMSSRKV